MSSSRRWLVIGCGGAGKSVFSVRLARALGLPLVHLDPLYWGPGWEPPNGDEWRATVAELADRVAWVMDGNYSGTLDLRIPRAEEVVFLDMPRLTCLAGVVGRRFRTRSHRIGMPAGCRERLDPGFLRWVWAYPTRSRPKVEARLRAAPEGCRIHRLRSRAEAERFLRGVEGEGRG